MELKEFKDYIENTESKKEFDYGISKPFKIDDGTAGVFTVAFEILEQSMTREEILANIQKVYEDSFEGCKSKHWTYKDITEVKFKRNKEVHKGQVRINPFDSYLTGIYWQNTRIF